MLHVTESIGLSEIEAPAHMREPLLYLLSLPDEEKLALREYMIPFNQLEIGDRLGNGEMETDQYCCFPIINSNIYVVTPYISPILGPLTKCCLRRVTPYCNQTCLLLKLCKQFSHGAF